MTLACSSSLQTRPVLLAACGNALAGDDGFGPRVARLVSARQRAAIEVVDLSLSPSGLLDVLSGHHAVILVDAVVVEGRQDQPLELLDLDCSDLAQLPLILDPAQSSHDLGLAWQLSLAEKLGILPHHVRLIALSIPPAQLGQRLSPAASTLAHRAAKWAIKWARHYETCCQSPKHSN